jgi:hypothetical protein
VNIVSESERDSARVEILMLLKYRYQDLVQFFDFSS